MASLLLAILLVFAPQGGTGDLDACLEQAPIQSPSPITWGEGNVQAMWGENPPVSPDSVRAYLSQLRSARECLLQLNPSAVSHPYLGNVMRTHFVETALLASLRRFPEAFNTFEEARAFFASEPPIPSTQAARTWWPRVLHQNEGYLHSLLGDLTSAIDSYLQAYEATPDHQFGLKTKHALDIGALFQRTQDYRSARHYYNLAERHLRASPSPPADDVRARVLKTQSDLILEQTLNTDFEQDSLKRAAHLARRSRALTAPGSERYFDATMALSESLGYLGAFEEAYRLNEEVRRYARTSDDARLLTFSLLKLGVLHVQTGRWARADSVLRKALSRAEGLGDLDYQRRILRTLGRLFEMRDRWEEAEHFYRKGVAVVEEYRESLTASQWSMTAFAQWREVHRGLVRTLLAQERPQEALVALDRSRARHLQDLRTQARISNQFPSRKRTRLDSLSRILSDVRTRLGEASLSAREEAELRNRETRLMAARQQLLQLDSDLSRPSLEAVSKTLATEDRVLVSYFLDDPWPVFDRSPRSVAFVLTGDTLRTVPLPGLTQDSVDTHVTNTSPLFTSRGKPDRANAMHFDLRPLHRLHDAVYAPVAAHLPDGRPLTVVPDGPLFHLPFSMLVDAMPGGRFAPAEARYVLHDRPVSLELASSLVGDSTRHRVEWSRFDPQLAAYGVSDFDTLRTVPAALRTAIPEALSDSSLVLPSLPGVRQELEALRSSIPDARVALNRQVSERAFCRSARSAGVLHVASHAFVNASAPLQNAILLRSERHDPGAPEGETADERSSGTDDDILFLHELQGQRSRIPMVVLSGCSTASGTLRGGEGMEGLQYAFRAMGAQSTISTLWPVADRVSVDIMDAFYRHLQDGHPKDVALRQAQLDFLEATPQKASPFFWAPLVLYGSPAPLPFDDPFLPLWAWWVLGAAGLLLVAGGLLWWNRNRLPGPFC